MESTIIIVHVLAAIGITGLVLLQHGKGADMGASFGSGASQTIFGSTGSGNALTQSTTWLAVIFFVTSLALAFLARQQAGQSIQDNGLLVNPDQIEATLNTAPAQDIPQAPAGNANSSDLPQVPGQAGAAVNQSAEETQSAAQNASPDAATNPDAEPENTNSDDQDQ